MDFPMDFNWAPMTDAMLAYSAEDRPLVLAASRARFFMESAWSL